MPVRIYDIAKKLGIESKEVLAKAKALGITAAKVASSSLDKITAEYLLEQFGGAPIPKAEPAAVPAPAEPILIVAPPAPPIVEPPAPVVATPPLEIVPLPPPPVETVAPAAVIAEPEVEAKPPSEEAAPPPVEIQAAPVTPPPPPVPRVGDKVGFIKLPTKPAPKLPDKAAQAKPQVRAPLRPEPPRGRTDLRPDNRLNRGVAPSPPVRQNGPAAARPATATPQRLEPAKPSAPTEPKFVPPATGELITLKPPIVVRDLAEHLKKKPFQLIADLMQLNVFANVNQAIDEAVAQKLCAKYGYRFEVEKRERGAGVIHAPVKKVELDVDDKIEDLTPRAPVVTIMGHVDHGKTTLLDVIRKSNVAAGEAGGITQHIGAYTISIPHPERPKDLQQITFLDTPGHAAFSSMRARGANVTDIVILVVAANDGVMPQTLEALSHAQAAKVPIIVAVNKCDHPAANTLKVRQQLQDKGLVSDEWGGDTIFQDVSALTKQGVDKLLEMIVFQAELLELKANPNRRAKGNVIESGLEPGGPTATVLVRKGTLHVGDIVICSQYRAESAR